MNEFELGGNMIFEDFCIKYWYDAYINGSTSSYPTQPTCYTER